MLNLHRIINRLTSSSLTTSTSASRALRIGTVILSKNGVEASQFVGSRAFSETSGGGGGDDDGGDNSTGETFSSSPLDDLGWDSVSSWSTGLTKEHFNGEVAGHHVTTQSLEIAKLQAVDDQMKELQDEYRRSKKFVDDWPNRMQETFMLLKQVREPGARGSYLKDSEKAEMYRLHKENPEVYTVERLAKDYKIMRQRVHAILYLKQDEEEMEKKLGHPLDDSVEQLLDNFPE